MKPRQKTVFPLFFVAQTLAVVLTFAAFVGSVGGCCFFNGGRYTAGPRERFNPNKPNYRSYSNGSAHPQNVASTGGVPIENVSTQTLQTSAPTPKTARTAAKSTEATAKTSDVYGPEPLTRGQAPDDGAAPFPTTDGSFPALADAFPIVDETIAPPTESEISPFISNGGTSVAEPTGEFAPATSAPEPQRESISDREATERKLEENYNAWLEKQKSKQKTNDKTPRYLRPLPNDRELFTDPSSPFARQTPSDEKEDEFIRQVTAADLSLMSETGNAKTSRELLDWEKEEPVPIDWSKYALTVARIRGWFGMGPDEQEALEYMRQACEKQKKYAKTKESKHLKEAAVLYERAAKTWPGPALEKSYGTTTTFGMEEKLFANQGGPNGTLIEEDGLFYAGECWYFYKDYNRALYCYKALVSTYNGTIYKKTATRRLYSIGCYWTEVSERNAAPSINVTEKDKPRFSSFAGAQKAFETIFLNDASDTGLAPAALFALANAYMRRGVNQGDGAFDSAARYYKQLYEFYPGSKYAEDACLLAMIALHKSYQGPFYDEAPLAEARKLAETALASGRCKIDVVTEELDNIKEEQAKHLFVAGQYYEKRGNFASARSYYNRLVREHPNSDYATEAARAYQNIESKPAEADQVAWLRPVVPFLPKSNNQYFEEAPDAEMSKIARRDESLDRLGKESDAPQKEENVATAPDSKRRY